MYGEISAHNNSHNNLMISEQIEAQILAKDNPDIWCEYSSLRTHRGGQRCWVVVVVEVGVQHSDPATATVRADTPHYYTMILCTVLSQHSHNRN